MQSFTIAGLAVGFTLWIALIVGVARRTSSPADDASSLVGMDVPEGSCPGTGSTPAPMSLARDKTGRQTGLCLACNGRFRLATDGLLPNHAPAPHLTPSPDRTP